MTVGILPGPNAKCRRNYNSPDIIPFCSVIALTVNIAKGTTDPRVEFISQVLTQILIKFHLQNLEQASTSKSQPNMNISTKVKPKNIEQT